MGLLINVSVTPTITASSAYSTGNALGGLLTLAKGANYGASTLRSLEIVDKAGQKAAIDVCFFRQSFTATADKSALAISTADSLNSAGTVSVATGDYVSLGTPAVATKANLWLVMTSDLDNNLYAQLVVRGTPTYASTADIILKCQFELMDTRSPML